MQISDKTQLMSLFPKNMKEEIKLAILQLIKDIQLQFPKNQQNLINLKDSLQEVFENDIIKVHRSCLMIEQKITQAYASFLSIPQEQELFPIFKHLLDQSLSPLIVLSVISSLLHLNQFERLFKEYQILTSYFSIIKKTNEKLIQYQCLYQIAKFAYNDDNLKCLLIENDSLNYLIRWINEDLEDEQSTLQVVRFICTNIKSQQIYLHEKLCCLIPHVVLQLIKREKSFLALPKNTNLIGKERSIYDSIEILLSLFPYSINKLMSMNQQHIVEFVEIIIQLACLVKINESALINKPSNQLIRLMLENDNLYEMILQQGYLNRLQFPYIEDYGRKYIDHNTNNIKFSVLLYISSKPRDLNQLMNSQVFQSTFINLCQRTQYMHYYLEEILELLLNLLKYNTQIIDDQLYQLGILKILKNCFYISNILLKCPDHGKLAIQCLYQYILNNRTISVNRSQEIKDLIDSALKFQDKWQQPIFQVMIDEILELSQG